VVDELAKKIAEAKAKMFGNLQPSGGKSILIVSGDVKVESPDKKVVVRKSTR